MYELVKDIDAGDEGWFPAGTLVYEENRCDHEGVIVVSAEDSQPFMVGHDEVIAA